ncbi:NUDIX domain-containing protein [Flavobacteriaceae sp. LMIT009]
MDNLKNIKYNILSEEWATLHRIDYDYQFKDGRWKTISRESYNRGNGTSVLLYNAEKQTVILTKQFRMPAYVNDEQDGMSIEVCAGALDKNEDPETCIIREIEEEVGYRVDEVKKVLECYMSPGAVTEKMYLFVAEYTDEMKVHSGGGLESEDEEIEVLEIPFTEALQMMKQHKIIDAKTQLLLQYAQINGLIK